MLIANVALVFGLAFAVRGRIHDHEDYLVAGRRLGLPLASLTLFATWFGAGTLLVATDEIRHHGLRAAALDPIGAGACLLLAGAFLAAPLWRMRLLTLVDFFRVRFGPRAETLGAILMVPGYFGWIAAQFVALASLLELLFGLDLRIGLALVAAVGTGYTLIGGMWSVVVTDAVQATLLVLGLATLAGACLLALGDGDASAGLSRLLAETPPERLVLVPRETLQEALAWLGVLAAGALGNLPGQDLMQRVFSSRSAAVARRACLVAGGAYWIVGIAPMGLGLAAAILAPDDDASMLAILAGLLLHPLAAAAFVTAVLAAVLSTIDSALLAPAAVLAENLLGRRLPNVPRVRLDRACVLAVAAASLAIAHLGEDAWSLLESAYEVGLVSLLVPLVAGLASTRGDERAALAAMGVGTVAWLAHGLLGWAWFAEPLAFDVAGWPLPVGLSCAASAAVAYVAAARRTPRIAPLPDGGDPTS